MNKLVAQYKKIPTKVKRSFIRFFSSFFFAWVVSVFLNDLPSISEKIQQMNFVYFLQNTLVWLSKIQLNLLGFETYSQGDFLQIVGAKGVCYDYSCLGIRHISIFLTFILFHYGRFWQKLIFIIIGSVIISLVNSFRVMIISIGQYINQDYFDIFHDVSTPILMYSTILLLMFYWTNYQLKNKIFGNNDFWFRVTKLILKPLRITL